MARENLFIKVGTYTGNASDGRAITGVGFRPWFVMTHRASVNAVCRFKEMTGDISVGFGGNNTGTADMIQEILGDGFQVGTNTAVNANTIPYYYLAIGGHDSQEYLKTGWYVGNATDSRDFTTGGFDFTPDFVCIKGNTAQNASFHITDSVGDLSFHFSGTAHGANEIQSLAAGGFQLGTSALVNSNTLNYYFLAMRHLAGAFKTGVYTGSGVARSITGLGFQPDIVMIEEGDGAGQSVMLTSNMVSASVASIYLGNGGTATGGITSLDSDGFSVGTLDQTNKLNSTIYWVAFKSGDFNAPLDRTAV